MRRCGQWAISFARARCVFRGFELSRLAHRRNLQHLRSARIDRPVVSQPYYNAMNRMPEVEQLPACNFYGLGVVPYSPLARGVLTGKYAPDSNPEQGTRAARKDTRMLQTEWRPESLQLAQTIRKHAEARGITAGQFAVAWVLNNRFTMRWSRDRARKSSGMIM